jgi:hypothetical protein
MEQLRWMLWVKANDTARFVEVRDLGEWRDTLVGPEQLLLLQSFVSTFVVPM